jgi:predicted MFS family arabinose efflux permease
MKSKNVIGLLGLSGFVVMRGAAMSLVAFCFVGGGGLGTAIDGKIIGTYGLEKLFWVYGLALFITLLLSYALIRDHVVEENELLE